MTNSHLSPRRSLARVAVLAALLVIAGVLGARLVSTRVRETSAAGPYRPAVQDAAERLLESRLGIAGFGGTPVCGTEYLGAEPPRGERRRMFVRVRCVELCARDSVVVTGSAVATAAALTLVRSEHGWHPVGFEAPTDANYAHDIRAIFPPFIRQRLSSSEQDAEIVQRIRVRAAERFPGRRLDMAGGRCG
jgi:hypothetical protein